MNNNNYNNEIINILSEREKELKCLYKIEEVLNDFDKGINSVFSEILDIIPSGWQFSDICEARILYNNNEFTRKNFKETDWYQSEDLIIDDNKFGKIEVFYTESIDIHTEKIFLPEEKKLLQTIAERLSQFILHKNMKNYMENWRKAKDEIDLRKTDEWRVVINLLKTTDINLYYKISRKMLNYLSWSGSKKARNLLESFCYGQNTSNNQTTAVFNENIPLQKQKTIASTANCDKIFEIAAEYLSNKEILNILQKWLKENKFSFLVKTIEDINTSITDIIDAMTKYFHTDQEKIGLTENARKNTAVMILHRFFSDQLNFINIAKNFIELEDFFEILKHSIFTSNSRGKFGGKSAGIFLANSIIKKMELLDKDFKEKIKTPKTWYITSDTLINFLNDNNLEEIIEQKYKDIEQIREEYPNIIQLFKNSYFSSDIIKGLTVALEDFGNKPIIVRSSSLLEDRFGSAFSGKYKSLFLANQGDKEQRLNALMDAIAEVYASIFCPDPIEYRKERELLDFHEQMGIIIMEVVGKKVGKYYFPAFAGVGYSNNEFRWSPRIKKEDGLLRLVPGLGTRAVDRLGNDFPKLIAPGKPNINVNVTIEETFKYSPTNIDVINLETNTFETIELQSLVKEYGNEYPMIEKLVSVYEDNRIINKSRFNLDFKNDDIVFTFDKLVSDNLFTKNMKILLEDLERKIKKPVDIEFAHDGENLYLLQCRPQGHSDETAPAAIPKDIPKKNIIFTANKYISNGYIPNISHIVYVVPEKYTGLSSLNSLKTIGRIIGKLNSVLPKRKFILMGPGRWGSRGDIKLGVNVTYSDINNTAVLIEVAKEKGNYVPDLSFGTHFFQDLVEASIRYIPLYPDTENVIFNEKFFRKSQNILPELLPEYSDYADTVKVIDINKVVKDKVLKVLMNAELDEAIAYIGTPSKNIESDIEEEVSETETDNHWMWRLSMAKHIAKRLKADYYGVEAMYIFGSTKNANAGPASDIDLLVHFRGNAKQKKELSAWFQGWSLCLSEINYLKTGYKTDGLLDVHFISDKDIEEKSSYAVKINAVTDAARPLTIDHNN